MSQTEHRHAKMDKDSGKDILETAFLPTISPRRRVRVRVSPLRLSVYLLEESLKGFTDIVPSLCTYFKEILDIMVICKLQLEHYLHTALCQSIPIG